MKEYKAYIFDMDLTLLNTLKTSIKSYHKGFEALGLNFDESTVIHHLSISLEATYNELFENGTEYRKFFDAFSNEAARTFKDDAFFYEDGVKLISFLKEKGKILGIVTNRELNNVNDVLENEPRLQNTFSSIVTGDRVKNLKPNPEPILKCLEELGVSKDEAVYIGDAKNDGVASKAAGIDFICIERYNNCNFECDNVVHDLFEVAKY